MSIPSAATQLEPFFRFPLRDNKSRSRFLVGTALILGSFIIPILPAIFVFGYVLHIMRASAGGESPVMPAWDDWTDLFSLGLRGMIVYLVYMLPALAVFTFGTVLYFGTFLFIPLLGNPESTPSDLFIGLMLLGMMAIFLSFAFGSLLTLLGIIPLPASLTHFALHDSVGAAFNVRAWWPVLSTNVFGYLIAFLLLAGMSAFSYFLFVVAYSTVILLCLAFVILPPISFYVMLVGASLFGEAYRVGLGLLEKSRRSS